ncbi:CaCA family Na(+)/Ca(+) antiporter [Oscillochloris trichoides DG-6]|uniref:CaCA family Na(+)/Ca(+) antiporter n=1 Tax=Oscillochloris trichoides DG-6 TaxID=765420 RepID=E1IAQ2_9CHLR|nr:calcium/sodium antiporter [Oscillochloris trichoides]EFO81731.1 CaCA family Na(+)/Ca(+) antiporter [Oscillochloris trichoides DG-6]
MDLMTMVLFVIGLVLLIAGAELLVRGASRLAGAAGIPPLIIGLTVVAFGTSAPEFAVSAQSALSGQADIALGNVVGSNIFNVLFILGASALIIPLVVQRQLVRLDVPIMIGASLLLGLLALDGIVNRVDGVILFVLLLAYIAFQVRQGLRESSNGADADDQIEKPKGAGQLIMNIGLIIVGLAMLVVGSGWLVDGAVAIARALGLSELIIGLTIIAAGTSLPEVAASMIAALRGERDIAVGNVVGSNIFNILGILGLTAVIAPSGVAVAPAALAFDIPVMIAVMLACLPIFFTEHRIARWEGGLFLGYYVAYTAYLVLAATNHDALPLFSSMMMTFVLPLTLITLVVLGVRAFMQQRPRTTAKV